MIPDKIYFPADGLPAYIDWDGSPVRTKQAEDSDVCYIRKDALMEWAEYIKTHTAWYEIEVAMDDLIDKLNSM